MKKNINLIAFFLLLGLLPLSTCRKIQKEMLVTTGSVSNLLTTTADFSGTVVDLGEGATGHGHCYATTPNPGLSGSKTELGTPAIGGFTSDLTGLEPETKYYVKAYLSKGQEVVYGEEINFTTASDALPQVTTTAVTGITKVVAVTGGNVTAQGGTPVTACGVCWSTAANPSVEGNKTADGSGTGKFTSNLSNLTAGTKYYIRAYATNAGGTAYGEERSFTTLSDINTPPVVTTAEVTSITATSAVCGGEVTNEGGASVISRGVCWSTSQNPNTANSKTEDGTGTGDFTSVLTGLTPGATYYVRAYATNGVGTTYGEEVSFTTAATLPTISTAEVSVITYTTASCGGNVLNDGGADVTARGVCWSTNPNPTTADSKTSNGTGTGPFTSDITALSAGTHYYVRAYATNSIGTKYGNQQEFTTVAYSLPTLTTDVVTEITHNSAKSGGNITADGGSAVTSRGICWSTSENPEISDNKTSAGTGTGVFTGNMTGLLPNTGYYVRAYATNSVGTAYGNNLSFTTDMEPFINVTAPSGSDHWLRLEFKEITWTSYNVTGTVVITLYKAGSLLTTIVSNKENSGSHIWNLPNDLTYGSDYKVRVASETNGSIYGESAQFKISEPHGSTGTVFDSDGNTYNTIKIGTQWWMAENLKTKKYRNNAFIGTTTPATLNIEGETDPKYQWAYNGDEGNVATYGRLYTWYAVTDSRNVCPWDWHVPTDAEWTTLTNYLGGESVAGGKLKEAGIEHWSSPNIGATNETGFTALPGGHRNSNGTFSDIGSYGYWWSSTEGSTSVAYYRGMTYSSTSVYTSYDYPKSYGFFVRCLRD